MKENDTKKMGEGLEIAGVASIALGAVGTVVSAINFIASEMNASPEEIQRLSTQIDPSFRSVIGYILIAGAGAG